jgi:hypothetical protein
VDEGERRRGERVSRDLPLRVLGVALALVAAAIHLVLFARDLIPGETTTVPAFAAMGLGFVGCAVILALGRRDLYVVVPIYAGLLVFAWASTRGQYPVEIFGITANVAEIGLAAVTALLIRRASSLGNGARRHRGGGIVA